MEYPEVTSWAHRFSVIVPLYNKEPYVEKALRSILAQTFSNYELIVVNDGSKDNSLAVAQRVLAGVGNAIIIDQENTGVSTARNNGVAASKGEYICFLDADDWWEPTFLEEMDKLIQDYPDAGLYCTNYYYVKYGRNNIKLGIPTGYFNYCKEYARTQCMISTSSSSSIKKSILTELGGFKTNLKLGEDFDLWIRIALSYGTAICEKPLAYFNNDIPLKQRATHHLYEPENHMLWNLGYLENEEKTNPDYKQLIDNLRVTGLFPYWLSQEYHNEALKLLSKVDWNRQSNRWKVIYKLPVSIIRIINIAASIASKGKKYFFNLFR